MIAAIAQVQANPPAIELENIIDMSTMAQYGSA
jgi:hypothetical protein